MNVTELKDKLDRCKNMTFEDINMEEIIDLSEVKVSRKKTSDERILDFLIRTSNPYFFKYKDRLVKIEFTNNNRTAEKCITNVLKSIYK